MPIASTWHAFVSACGLALAGGLAIGVAVAAVTAPLTPRLVLAHGTAVQPDGGAAPAGIAPNGSGVASR